MVRRVGRVGRVGHSLVNRLCCFLFPAGGRILRRRSIGALSMLYLQLILLFLRTGAFLGPGSDVLWCHDFWARGETLMGTLIGDE